MKTLTVSDFVHIPFPGISGYYFASGLSDDREVCLEPCLNGFDVAIYDKNKDLIGEKTCTNIDNAYLIDQFAGKLAIKIANEKIKQLEVLDTNK